MDNEMEVFFVTKDNNIMGNADYSRLRALIWYKRLFAKICKKYRENYIDIKPFKCQCE